MSSIPSGGPRTWFITGCSSGFGRAIAEAALQAGDRVVLTARDVSTIEPLAAVVPDQALALALDITREDQIHAALGEQPRAQVSNRRQQEGRAVGAAARQPRLARQAVPQGIPHEDVQHAGAARVR